MYGCKQIILHNSYVRGKMTTVKCDGHTNNSGKNGAGKSTTLRLVPIFYGNDPEKVIKASGKSNFAGHYLPTKNSMIIFEYLRDDGLNCVVMYRNFNQNKVNYRFIKSGFSDAFEQQDILDMMLGNADAGDIVKEISNKDILVSKPFSIITDYRSIIQNNETLLRRKGNSGKSLRHEAAQFCLGSKDAHSSNIDEISYALLYREKLLPNLKNMIANTMLSGIADSKKPEDNKSKSLLEDIKSVKEFDKESRKIEECIREAQDYNSTVNRIAKAVNTINCVIENEKDTLTELKSEIEVKRDQLSELREERESVIETLKDRISENESNKKQVTKHIETIHSQRDKYEDMNIERMRRDFERLADFEQERDTANEQYNTLKSSSSHIEDQREGNLSKAKEQCDKNVASINEKMVSVKDEIHQKEKELQEQVTKINRERSEKIESFIESLRLEETELARKEAKLQSESKNVQFTDDELVSIQKIENQINMIDSQIKELTKKIKLVSDEYEAAKSKMRSVSENHKKMTSALKTMDAQLSDLKVKRFPADGTLLSELKKYDSNWGNTIGKVINPSLLQSKVLSPDYLGDTGSVDFYGWSLDLESIEQPEESMSEEILDDKIKRLEEQISSQVSMIKEEEKSLKKATADADHIDMNLIDYRQALSGFESDREAMIRSKKEKNQEAEKSREYRRASIIEELRSVEKDIKSFNDNRVKRISEIKESFSSHEMEVKGVFATDIGTLKDSLSSLEDGIKDAKTKLKEQLDIINTQFDELLKKEGVDPKVIRDAKERADLANKKLSDVKFYSGEIESYKTWLSNQWSQIGRLNEDEARLEIVLSALRKEETVKKNEFRDQERNLKTDIEIVDGKIKKLYSDIENAKKAVKGVEIVFKPSKEVSSTTDLVSLSEKLNSEHSDAVRIRRSALSKMNSISLIIAKYQSSQIASAWSVLVSARMTSSEYEEYSNEFELEKIMDLKTLVEESIPQTKSALINNLRSFAQTVYNYHTHLKQISSKIGRISSELGKAINSDQKIGDISDVEIIINSQIERYDCWNSLDKFSKAWDVWNSDSEDEELPSEDLISLLNDANEDLANAKIKDDKASMIDLAITFKEKGNQVNPIRTDSDFNSASSNGLSYLAICIVFMGISRYLCPNENVEIMWPIDELTAIDPENIGRLFAMLNERNLVMFSAFPSTNPLTLQHFKTKNIISDRGISRVSINKVKAKMSDLKAEKAKKDEVE